MKSKVKLKYPFIFHIVFSEEDGLFTDGKWLLPGDGGGG